MQDVPQSNPLVSIIVRTKDRPSLLLRALSSIANVNYQNKEVVIVNDGGCDINKEEVSTILKGNKFEIYVNKTTLGRAEALNKGITNSRGDLICFLDDDDLIYPDGIGELVKAFNGVYNKVIYGNVVCRKYEGNSLDLLNEWVLDNPYDRERLVLENYIPINSLCIPKRFLLQIGPLDPAFLIYEDWDMLLRLSEITDFLHINKTIAEYSIFGTSTITGKEGLEFQKHYRQKILTKHFHKITPAIIIKYILFAPHFISKEREIEQIQSYIKKINDQLNFYKDQLNFYQNLSEKLDNLEKENAELRIKIKELYEQKSKTDKRIEKLNKENANVSFELSRILNSRSWRMTAPLRKIMHHLRQIIGVSNRENDNKKEIEYIDTQKCHELIDGIREKVEIIIVNYNGLEHLKRSLPSVLNTNYPFFSVTVVDNNSTDGSVEYIQRNYPEVKIIKNPSNLGFGAANDKAIQQSDARLIALLNNDTEVEPNWLTYLVCYILSDGDIAATSSKLLLMKHPSVLNNAGGGMSYLGFGYDIGLYLPDSNRDLKPKEILFPSGAACLMRKEYYERVGGFDSSFFMYHEDVDLGWRFWIYGYRVIFVPQSRVYHAYGGTSHSIGGHSLREVYGLQHALRSLIKNYQLPHLARAFTLFLLLCLKKYPHSFWKIIKWNLKVLRSSLSQRKIINENRVNSDLNLFQKGLIDKGIYPNVYHPDYEIINLESFKKSGNTRDFILMAVTDSCNLGYGWHRKEIWHKDGHTRIRCTMSEAVAYLYSEISDGHILMEVASLSIAIGLKQSFSLFINDNQIADFVIEDDNMKVIKVPFKDILGLMEIRLKVNKTFIPNKFFRNGDERDIGIAVKSIRIKPSKEEKVLYRTISVIIPTYNRVNELIKTLNALEEQTLSKERFEVIIVDDGSTDSTAERVKGFIQSSSLNIKYFYQENKKPAAARNLGIKMSVNDLILFLGDDTTPDKDFLKVHLDTHNAKNTDQKLAVLGYTTWPIDYHITPFLEFINGYGSQFGYELIKDGEVVNFSLFYTSNISLSRNLLNCLDYYFDENFKIAGWEDTDIGYRLQKKGMSILYNANAKTYHYHKMDILSFCKRQYNIGRFARLMYDKHPELYEFLNINRVHRWSRHKPLACLLKYFIYVCDMLKIQLPYKLYSYVLNVHYSVGYLDCNS